MSDLIFESDSSGAERDINELSSAVKELRAALMLLNNAPTSQLQRNLANIATKTTYAFEVVEGRLAALERSAGVSASKVGVAVGKGMAEGVAKGFQSGAGAATTAMKRLTAEMQQDAVSAAKAVKAATASAMSAYSSLSSGSIKDPFGGRMAAVAAQARRQVQEATAAAKGVFSELRSMQTVSKSGMAGFFNMPSKADFLAYQSAKVAEALAAKQQIEAAVRTATAQAAGSYSSLKTAKMVQVKNLDLLFNMPSKADFLAYQSIKAAEALSAKQQIEAAVRTATAQAAGSYSSLKTAKMVQVKNLDLLFNMPSKADFLAYQSIKAAEAASAAQQIQAAVKAATLTSTSPYSAVSSGRLMNKPLTPAMPELSRGGKGARVEFEDASRGARMFTGELNDMHSAARGVASGFNAIWLTWGNIGPLLAGAALSNGFVQAVRKGAQFQQTLTAIEALAGETSEGVAKIGQAALAMGREGPFGPLEIADAMKTLALAGLSAKEQLEAISAVRNFAIVGEVDLKRAAEDLVAIATAYGYSASEFSIVGDIIGKTAASSMASIDDMSEAFKQASVVAQQYGVSLEDTSTTLALLSQVGIRGSAAGTSMRNMYVELMGTSKKARKVIDETIGVKVWDETAKAMKPLPLIMEEMAKALSAFGSEDQVRILQELGNERGTKALSANLAALRQQALSSGETVVSAFYKMRDEIGEAPGYMAQAAAVMATTSQNQLKSIATTLESSLIEAFKAAEPEIQLFARTMREALGSEEFRGAVTSLTESIARLLGFLVRNADTLATLVKMYVAYKTATMAAHAATLIFSGGAALLSRVAASWTALIAVVRGYAALKAGVASSTLQAQAAMLGLTTSTTAAAGATVTLRTAAMTLLRFLGPLGIAITAAGMAWSFLSRNSASTGEQSLRSVETLTASRDELMRSIDNEIERLEKKAEVEALGMKQSLVNAAVEKRIAEERIKDINREQLAILDREADEARSRRSGWMSYVPGLGDDIEVGVQNQLRDIDRRRGDVMARMSQDLGKVSYKMDLAIADAERAAQRIAADRKTIPTGDKTFDPDSLDASGRSGVSVLKDNAIKEMERLYGIALKKTEDFSTTQKRLLDAQRQSSAISQAQYSARELDLTEQTEIEKLAVINSYGQQVLRLYDERREYLNKSLSDLQASNRTPEQKKAGAEKLNQELENLSNSQRTFVEGLSAERDKVENSIYERVRLIAIAAQGEIRKLNEDSRKFAVEEANRAADREADSGFQQSLRGVGPGMAEVLRAEYEEKKRLLLIDRERTQAILEQERAISEFVLETKDSLSFILTGEMSREQLATMDAMTQKLERMKELREGLRGQVEGKVSAAGGQAAADQLANLGNLDLASAFDSARVSIDGMVLSLGDAVTALTALRDQQDLYAKAKAAAGKDTTKLAKVESDAFKANLKGTADLLKSTKGFFKEKTAAYKALDAVEKGYRLAQIALAAKEFAQKMGWIAAETSTKLASEGIKASAEAAGTATSLTMTAARTQAKGVEALVAQLTLPFPANVPAFAMVAAMLAALGVAVKGGGGGGGGFSKPNEGKGTVLGDSEAESESVKRSASYLKELVTLSGVDLQYTSQMARSLNSLVVQLGGVASLVTRNGSTQLAASQVATGYQPNAITKLAGGTGSALSLFGSSAFGMLGGGALGALTGALGFSLGGALSGLGKAMGNMLGKIANSLFGTKVTLKGSGLYVDPTKFGTLDEKDLRVKSYADVNVKQKTFGVTTSNKNKTKYVYAGDETSQQFSMILQNLGSTLISAAGPLMGGVEKAEALLDSYTIKLGKISLKGLKGDAIEKRLNAVFSAEGDKMATYLLPQLRDLQRVGEGYMETLVRVSSSLELVNDSMSSLGYTMYQSSISGARLAVSLIEAFGGMDEFNASMGSYYKNYYSLEERNAVLKDRLTKAVQRLGFAMPQTTAEYRKMVDEFVAGGGLLTEAGQAIYAELISLSEPFYEYSEAVQELADGATSAAQKIMDYVKKLQGDRAGLATPMQQLQAARSAYVEDLAKARGGDKEAQDRVTERADAYIEAQKAVTSSSAITQAVIDQIIAELTQVASGIPAFASGGYHSGGWALVGEQGPELAYFGGAARIYNAQDTGAMLAGGGQGVEARLEVLVAEVQALRAQQSQETREIVSSNVVAQQQAAGALLDGLTEATERQMWVQNNQPVIK